MKKTLAICAALAMAALGALGCSEAEDEAPGKITWPDGRKAAIALTYDDALDTHLDVALPALDARALKGTFFVTVGSYPFTARFEEWRALTGAGHELANHTLFHPCTGGPGRDWVMADRDLATYTAGRFVDELALTNRILEALDGESVRTYAYTCGDTEAGGESIIEALAPYAIAARTVRQETPVDGNGLPDTYLIGTYAEGDPTGAQLIAYAERILAEGTVGTYLFHDIEGEHLSVTAQAHGELLDWLVDHEDEIWVTTFREIMEHVRAHEAAE
ncbi:chitooligosaccharide deacetylase [Aquisalinus flavus]|uniref:Chitooligosaccharide deacetylase n=1 Tax=Aquisalinus flavus TaxID=1526572 RepID=A0A8J2Y8C0_9PROT|nr:polysaccharide deacetylase family protein [Aquisalinus flavus]MBD0428058.1 polysaccharide deacetylase family protein [Aquisalinus flavus]GGD18993.1 chitooligosaccharide deacetylase [Aquisalinus flavus]